MMKLSPIDEHLFNFFHDIKNIIDYAPMYPKLKDFKDKAEQYLKNKEYSDINMQDEKGNTLLHLVGKYSNTDYMEYFLQLLLNGANPFIKNNKNVNCFQAGNNFFINKFWKIIEDISLKDFYVLTNGYNKEFKQSILEEKSAYFKNFEEITQFLEKNDLVSHKNIALLLCKSDEINYTDKIKSFLTLDTIPEDNSFLLNHLMKNTFIFSAFSTTQQQQTKDTFLSFVSQYDFAYNQDFISFISNDNILNTIDKVDLTQEIFYHVTKNLSFDKVDLYAPVFIKNAQLETQTTLFELLNKKPIMYNILMEKHLHKIVHNNNKSSQKKLKL